MIKLFKNYKNFKIQKNSHSCGWYFGGTTGDSVKFNATFSEQCIYTIKDNDKYDVNKLFGFSTSWHHSRQSARIGWRCVNGKDIEILTYTHENGKISFSDIKLLGTVSPNQKFSCTINDNVDCFIYTFRKLDENELVFTKNDKTKSWFPFKYYLYPYFGGNKPAPHTMGIEIELFK